MPEQAIIRGKIPGSSPAAYAAFTVNADGSQPSAPATLELAGLSAAVLNADLLPQTDVSVYRSATVQLSGAWVGGVTFQGSNDGVTFFTIPWTDITVVGAAPQASAKTVNGLLSIELQGFRWLRIRATSYTSGTIGGTVELSSATISPHTAMTVLSSAASSSAGVTGLTPIVALGTVAPFRTNSADNVGSLIKSSTAVIVAVFAVNTAASARYLKFYNKATLATSGDTPELTLLLPPNSNTIFTPTYHLRKSLGLSYRVTTGAVDSDNTAPTAGDVFLTVEYL